MDNFPDLYTAELRSFLALVETGSFTEAAARVGRTQSAVSQQIKRLEEMVGKPLLSRAQKQVALTMEGEIFIGYAERIVALKQEMFTRFHEPEMAGEIRFGMPEDFATLYLPEILSAFSSSHPKIILHVECDLTLHLADKFKKGEYDLVVLKQLKISEGLKGIPMWSEHLEWVGAPGFSVRKKMEFLPLVLSPSPCIYRKRALEALDRVNIPWQIVYTSPSFAGTVAAVKAGLGVTVLPGKIIPDHLVPLRAKHLPDLSNTHIVLLTKPQPNPVIQAFAEYVMSRLR